MEKEQKTPARLALTDCRHFGGEPEKFWNKFGAALVAAAGGKRVLFLKWKQF